MNVNLDYWVFTSGEKGIHEMDWGVKHASPAFADRFSLDIRYRALLKDFSLPPSLEHPGNGVGLLLLPYEGGASLLGFIFPGTDHQGRPNTSAVVCVIPKSVSGNRPVAEVARRVWENNDLEAIALRGDAARPNVLTFDGERVVSAETPSFVSTLNWPAATVGYLQVNGTLKKLARAIPQEPEERNPKETPRAPLPVKKIALVFALAAAVGLGTAMMLNSNAPEEPEAPQPVPPVIEQGQEQGEAPNPDTAPSETQEEREKAEAERKPKQKRLKHAALENAEAKLKRLGREAQRKYEAEQQRIKRVKQANDELRDKTVDIWRSLELSDAQAGALIDVLLAEKFDRGDYGRQFKSVMDVAAIKAKLDGIIATRLDETDNYINFKLTGAGAWLEFKQGWTEGTVFNADSSSPSSGQGTAVEDVYKKLEGILKRLDGESTELIFIFRTWDERFNLMFRRMVNSERSGKPKRYILTKSQDFMETDLHLFDGVKQAKRNVNVISINRSDAQLGTFFGF